MYLIILGILDSFIERFGRHVSAIHRKWPVRPCKHVTMPIHIFSFIYVKT